MKQKEPFGKPITAITQYIKAAGNYLDFKRVKVIDKLYTIESIHTYIKDNWHIYKQYNI